MLKKLIILSLIGLTGVMLNACNNGSSNGISPTVNSNSSMLSESGTPDGPISQGINAITKGVNRYVAVGNNVIISSVDGNSWLPESMPVVARWHGVVYSSAMNKFFAVGDNGYVLDSNDGIAWSLYKTLAPDANLLSINLVGNDKLLIGGESGRIFEVLLTNGLVTSSQLSSSVDFVSAASNNNALLLVGRDRNTGLTDIYFKPLIMFNRSGWSHVAKENGTINNIYYSNNTNSFIVVGLGGEILVSADGRSWQPKSNSGIENFSGLSFDASTQKYIAIGSINKQAAVFSSLDLQNWELQNIGDIGSQQLNSVNCFANDSCFISGESGMVLRNLNSESSGSESHWQQLSGYKLLLASGGRIDSVESYELVNNDFHQFILQANGYLVCYGKNPDGSKRNL